MKWAAWHGSVCLPLGDPDECLWWAVEEDEFSSEFFLQLHLPALPHQVDVKAQPKDAIHVGELVEHDLIWNATEIHAHKLTNHKNQWHVQADDSVQRAWKEVIQ